MQKTPNIERNGDETVYWESYWQKAGKTDLANNPYPVPANENPWNSKLLISKLKILQGKLENTDRSTLHDEWTCPLCKVVVSDRSYTYRNMNWDASLKHQIRKHNWHPSRMFLDFLLGATIEIKQKGSVVLAGRHENGKLFVTQNQWGILDALMHSGGKRQWADNRKKMRYTETAGVLNRIGNRVGISLGESEEEDPIDKSILFPNEMPEVAEHEYYFHTHPPTSRPGGRVKTGILYEFPSSGDILHYIHQQSYGKTVGSLIIAPEGVYIIGRDKQKKLNVPRDAGEIYFNWLEKTEDQAITDFKLKGTPTIKQFYEEIATEKKYVKSLDKHLQTWGLRLHFIPRTKVNGKWIIEGGYLP